MSIQLLTNPEAKLKLDNYFIMPRKYKDLEIEELEWADNNFVRIKLVGLSGHDYTTFNHIKEKNIGESCV
jgi:hypothetical protein